MSGQPVAPAVDRPAHAPCTEGDEGAAYARALLDRIGAGADSPDDLATLLQFLHSGALLHCACLVLFAALSVGAGARAAR